jgi:hypothetical protein
VITHELQRSREFYRAALQASQQQQNDQDD